MNEITLQDDLARLGLGPRTEVEDNSNDLGQEDFLTLMLAQFRNQDPLSPVEDAEFLGQLAQFGTVDGIGELNDAFASLSATLYSDQALQAANLVGHRVLANSDRAHLPESGNLSGAVELSSSAQNVQVDILDDSGQLLRRLELGQQARGLVEFQWDGMTDGGEPAEPGNYSIEARIIRGNTVEGVATLVNAQIDSVNLGGAQGGMSLNLAGGEVLSMSQVRRIL